MLRRKRGRTGARESLCSRRYCCCCCCCCWPIIVVIRRRRITGESIYVSVWRVYTVTATASYIMWRVVTRSGSAQYIAWAQRGTHIHTPVTGCAVAVAAVAFFGRESRCQQVSLTARRAYHYNYSSSSFSSLAHALGVYIYVHALFSAYHARAWSI